MQQLQISRLTQEEYDDVIKESHGFVPFYEFETDTTVVGLCRRHWRRFTKTYRFLTSDPLYASIVNNLKGKKHVSILDIGCGLKDPTEVAEQIFPFNYLCEPFSKQSIPHDYFLIEGRPKYINRFVADFKKQYKEIPENFHYALGNVVHRRIAQKFDLVVISGVLNYELHNYSKVIFENCLQAVKRGGFLVVNEPAELWGGVLKDKRHYF